MQARHRSGRRGDRPSFSIEDLGLLAKLPLLKASSHILREKDWPKLCRLLARASSPPASTESAIRSYFGNCRQEEIDPRSVAVDVGAARVEQYMQTLRARRTGGRSPWAPATRLTGLDGLRRALEDGRGAVLWVAHFAFAPLAAKAAFADAGYRIWHMSRPEHGFSKTRFGVAVLNPLRSQAEEQFLAGRIIIDRDKPAAAPLRAARLLSENAVVSITAGAWEGSRVLEAPFGPGVVEIANGAPALAHLSGAQLFPVVALRPAPGAPIDVMVLEPLAADRSVGRSAWVAAATHEFAARVDPFVRRHPDQWRDWSRWRLFPGEADA